MLHFAVLFHIDVMNVTDLQLLIDMSTVLPIKKDIHIASVQLNSDQSKRKFNSQLQNLNPRFLKKEKNDAFFCKLDYVKNGDADCQKIYSCVSGCFKLTGRSSH